MPNDAKARRSSIQSIDRATAILKALASGPRRLDFDLGPGHLGGQIRKPARELTAVGDQYNPDQIRHSPRG